MDRGILVPLAALALIVSRVPAVAQQVDPRNLLHVVDRAERGEVILVLGPVDLAPGGSHAEHSVVPLQTARFPRSGWISGFATEIVDASGARVPQTFLHHLVVIEPDQRALFSPTALRIIAAGTETGQQELPRFMGLPIKGDQELLVNAMFRNPTALRRSHLSLRIRLEFTPATDRPARVQVYPFYLDVKPAVGSKAFDLPPGTFVRSWQGRPAISGRLLEVAGHVHDYAKVLRLEDVTEGMTLWEVAPILDAAGRLKSVPQGNFWKNGGMPIRSDHLYRLSVTYQNPTGRILREGGMGTLGGAFVPDPGEVWPKVDKSDADYIADLRWTSGVGGETGPPARHATRASWRTSYSARNHL
jgi:hypothetical protein